MLITLAADSVVIVLTADRILCFMKWIRVYLQRFLLSVAKFVCRHPRKIFFVSVFFAIIGIWLSIFRLGVLNDTNALIRQDSPSLKDFLAYVREFEAPDPIVVIIQSPDFEKNRQAADALAQKFDLRKNDIQSVYYKNDLSRLKPHFLLYQTEDELRSIIQQLRAQKDLFRGKTAQGVNLNSLLDEALNQFDRVSKARGGKGTLDDLGSFADHMIRDLEKLANNLDPKVKLEEGNDLSNIEELDRQILLNTYLSFEEGHTLLMMIHPKAKDAKSFSPYKTLIRNLRKDITETKKQFPEIQIGLTGEPVLRDDELKQSTQDMLIASVVAFLAISLLFFAAYRELIRPVLALFSLACALFWSLGFTVFAVGHLNIISQAFVLMLLGLGIDFGIQILGRYEEERSKGRNVFEAVEHALQYTGTAVVTSGGITAVAFFTMCFNDFIGLAELGIIAGCGVIFCMVANIVLLPAILVWRDKGKVHSLSPYRRSKTNLGGAFDKILLSRPRTILAIASAGTLLAVAFSLRVSFDHNLLNLQNPKIESVRLVHQLLKSDANSFLFGVVIANDMDDARLKTSQLEKLPSVKNVNSPSKILPENQRQKLEILKELRFELRQINFNPNLSSQVNVAKAKANLEQLLKDSQKGLEEAKKFRNAKDPRVQKALTIFDRLIPALEKSVRRLNRLPQDEAEKRLNHYQVNLLSRMKKDIDFLKEFDMENEVSLDALPPEALRHYISKNSKVLLEVQPKENIWEREPNEKFVRDLRSIDPAATGTPVQNYVYIDILKKSYVQAAWWALAAIAAVIGFYFRSIKYLLITLVPLFMGTVWTLAFMTVFKIQFNPANIITLPLVVGIGVAYGVYIVDRYLEEGKVRLFASSTGKAVLLSALTTMLGFAAMMIGSYRGLVSLGLVMTVGIFFCYLASTVVLPQILVLMKPR